MSKVLIVGGGHAGANTAFALRKDGFDGELLSLVMRTTFLIIDLRCLKIS
jgi:glycine/D-amino acid oxidase-like deaminating enzyme